MTERTFTAAARLETGTDSMSDYTPEVIGCLTLGEICDMLDQKDAALTAAAERETKLREENERLKGDAEFHEGYREELLATTEQAIREMAAERQKVQALREEILARIDALSNSGHPEDKAIKTSLQSTLTDMDALGLPSPDAPQPPRQGRRHD